VNESGLDESGIDMGGLYKEFITAFIEKAFNPDYGSGLRIQGSGFRDQNLSFRVQGSGFRVQGSDCRVQGSGSRVKGLLISRRVIARVRYLATVRATCIISQPSTLNPNP
jgi:hypothetical protein